MLTFNKKIMFIILGIIMCFVYGIKVKASSGYTEQEIGARIKEIVFENQNVNNDYNVNYYDRLGRALNLDNNSQTFSLVTYQTSSGYVVAYVGVLTDNTTTSFSMTGTAYYTSFKGTNWVTNSAENPSLSGVLNVIDNGTMSNWMNQFEYTNLHFDATIPYPEIYSAHSSLNSSNYGYQVPTSLEMVPVNTGGRDLYLLMYYRFFKAREIEVTKDGRNNPVENVKAWYTSINYTKFSYPDTVPTTAYTIDFNDYDVLKGDWEDFASNKTTTYTGLLTGWYGLWSDGLYDTDHYPQNRWCGSYGSMFQVYMAYAEVRDGELYTGYFVKYDSTSPTKLSLSQMADLPILQTGGELNYTSNTVSPLEAAEAAEAEGAEVPTNVNSGNNFTINVSTQQVPNDMNYPTIVSYNHDNIFTTFTDTYKTAGTMLKDYGQFFTQAVTWIPGEIWSIIGMGFSMAIVIMIIKIL